MRKGARGQIRSRGRKALPMRVVDKAWCISEGAGPGEMGWSYSAGRRAQPGGPIPLRAVAVGGPDRAVGVGTFPIDGLSVRLVARVRAARGSRRSSNGRGDPHPKGTSKLDGMLRSGRPQATMLSRSFHVRVAPLSCPVRRRPMGAISVAWGRGHPILGFRPIPCPLPPLASVTVLHPLPCLPLPSLGHSHSPPPISASPIRAEPRRRPSHPCRGSIPLPFDFRVCLRGLPPPGRLPCPALVGGIRSGGARPDHCVPGFRPGRARVASGQCIP
jgi:hypothetical protein